MNTTGKKGYWPIVQELRPGPNDGEEPNNWHDKASNKRQCRIYNI
jgi:hypothetical protein